MTAIALLEFESVARGIVAGDAMIKRAPLALLRCGTVQPGRFLVLVGGGEAEVDEALTAGREHGGAALVDVVHLPNIHPQVLDGLKGRRRPTAGDALGIVETATVPAAISAADAALKGVAVTLIEIRLADGLGGKGIVLLTGEVADVEAGVELGIGTLQHPDLLVASAVISQLHPEMAAELLAATRFRQRVQERAGESAWESGARS
ncbi:MAG: BMC domain-containing protein [Ardenticatenaceae bacterium]|nr:BMC domain-containing protein [Ardenticatenaceae bacterium]